MKELQKSYQRSTYFDFLKIDTVNWKEKVRFFERRYEDINDLDYRDQVEIWFEYAIATYELGKYHQFLSLSDELITSIFEHNIVDINGRDAFQSLLKMKGYSLVQLGQYDDAIHIFSELVKIDPYNNSHIKAYSGTVLNKAIEIPNRIKLLSIVSVIVFLTSSIADLLLVSPFYGQWDTAMTTLIIIALILSFAPPFVIFAKEYLSGRIRLQKLLKYSKNK